MDAAGDYIIQKQLGHGPFGEVFLAEHRFIKRLFALKALPESVCSDPSFIRRFEANIATIASLNHPNILRIHNVSYSEGRYFVVTDPIIDSLQETIHLERFLQLKGKSLSEDEIFELLKQVASALEAAHEAGVVHGSLKLTNILVVSAEQGVKLLLSDFGLTRLIGEGVSLLRLYERIAASFLPTPHHHFENAVKLSQSFLQGLAFLAPEQKKLDAAPFDAKVDAYAFGILAYYMLLHQIPEGCFDPPSRCLAELKWNWDFFISRCLQPNPHVRPKALLSAMQEYLNAPKAVANEMFSLAEIEKKVAHIQQMAFEFSPKQETVGSHTPSEAPRPVLNPQELKRPEFDADPGAIFHRETTVSHYTPQKTEENKVEPLLSEMVVIHGGTYMRGSNDGARDEMPRHAIKLPSFAIDIHPVTNEQFARFLTAMGGEKDQNNNDIIRLRDSRIKRSGGQITIESGYARHPVVGVTWYGAIAYAKWIGKRLPFEAEWEVAASGGLADYVYPTGANIERTAANFFSSDTTAIMSYPPNPFGLYDVAGNVYEWCQDWYAYNYYDTSSAEPEKPMGPHQGVYRVLRGGCWKSLKEDLRCSHRHRNNPGAVNSTYGFRCAADVATSS